METIKNFFTLTPYQITNVMIFLGFFALFTRNLNTFEKINLSKPLKNGYFFVKF